MAWGNRDTKDNVILTGIDAALLENYRLRDGATYGRREHGRRRCWAVSMPGMASDPFWSLLVLHRPDGDALRHRQHRHDGGPYEYSRPDPERAALAGHMLPFRKWDHMLGWTADYLEEARLTDIEADLLMGLDAVRNRWRMSLLATPA
jgi:hypothetical protein